MPKKRSTVKKQRVWLWIMGILLVASLATIGITQMFSIGGENFVDKKTAPGDYSYLGKIVEYELSSSNKYNSTAVDPTFYVYDSQPANWGNARVSVEDGYISTYSSTSGVATLQEEPGTYYVRSVLSGYYDEFMTVTVPSSGDVPLSDYNDGGEEVMKVQFINVETLSVSNQDLGILTNETSDKTYHLFTNFNVDDDEGYRLDEIKFREDATYSFATDTDGDGIYDEGINEIKFIINGKSYTLFSVASSIDQFSGDDEAIIDIDGADKEYVEYGENGVVSMKFEITCDQTDNDAVGDADEKCGNGEDFLDSVILVDFAGNTASFDILG